MTPARVPSATLARGAALASVVEEALAGRPVAATAMNLHIFDRFPVITTPRLVLRELAPADGEAVLALRRDEEVNRYQSLDAPATLQQARALIARWRKRFSFKAEIRWAVATREDGRFAGTCAYAHFVPWSTAGTSPTSCAPRLGPRAGDRGSAGDGRVRPRRGGARPHRGRGRARAPASVNVLLKAGFARRACCAPRLVEGPAPRPAHVLHRPAQAPATVSDGTDPARERLQVGRLVDVEGEALAAVDADPEARGLAPAQVAVEAVARAERGAACRSGGESASALVPSPRTSGAATTSCSARRRDERAHVRGGEAREIGHQHQRRARAARARARPRAASTIGAERRAGRVAHERRRRGPAPASATSSPSVTTRTPSISGARRRAPPSTCSSIARANSARSRVAEEPARGATWPRANDLAGTSAQTRADRRALIAIDPAKASTSRARRRLSARRPHDRVRGEDRDGELAAEAALVAALDDDAREQRRRSGGRCAAGRGRRAGELGDHACRAGPSPRGRRRWG